MGKIVTTQTGFVLVISFVVGQVLGCVFNSDTVEQLNKRYFLVFLALGYL